MALSRIAFQLLMNIINLTGAAFWRLLGIKIARLDEESVWRGFSVEEKNLLLDPKGPDPHWSKRLSLSLQCWAQDSKLTTCGRLFLKSVYVDTIRERLNVITALREQDPTQVKPICKPIFIVSSNRTGSTLLQALLASDPANTAPLLWELVHPTRSSPLPKGISDRLDFFYTMRPQHRKKHLIAPTMPHECYHIYQRSEVCKAYMVVGQNMEPYKACIKALPREHVLEMFRFYKQQLELILSGRKDKTPKTFILKESLHSMFIGPLLEVFPDAMIINIVRDPVESVPSACSMIEDVFAMVYAVTDLNRQGLGQRVLDHTVDCVSNLYNFRQEHPSEAHRFIDVSYADLTRAPLVTLEAIYTKMGLTLTKAAKGRMMSYLARNPQHKHGHHAYTAEKYGLTNDIIRKRLGGFYSQWK
ncbi:uncharacterized protein LOC106172463 [Lingula anatina]|uniref:Uncharacterized protein LOC106172463 n=1 Tax=Lingula anatina TaxID=7574 RepID=A0A1S3JFI3_LINAN|nr:uncharacterized protein LOC106172463 [Lingula anatina]|eukprot:XP_013408649.1 uncharacterized protein LOC106172463 [Lingula anatina]